MAEPRRKIAMIPSVKSSLRRRSGVRNAWANALSNLPPALVMTGGCASWLPLGRHVLYRLAPRRSETSTDANGRPGPPGRPSGGSSRLGQGPACCLDLLLGRGRPRVGDDLELDGDLTAAEHLDGPAGAHRTLGDEVLGGHRATLRVERGQAVEVDDLVLRAEGVLETAELGQPHVQRHLPALEAGRHGVAGFGALGATARGLAPASRLTTTHADLGALGAGRGTQVVHLERTLRGLLGLCHG